MRYVIPEIPPSNNRYAGRQNCWEYRAEKQRWKLLVRQAVGRKIPPKPLSCAKVTLIYHFKDNRRRDPDNYSGKMILDGLTAARIIADDSFFCINLQLRAVYDKSGITEIIVEEMKPCSTKQF